MKPNVPQRKRADSSWARLFFASLMSSSALAGAAAAQTTSDEIIVTATKRAENIQDVPQSIQALGASTLEEHQVSSFGDYATLLPSVSYQSFGPSQAQLAFRGVSSGGDGLPIGSSPTASMYLDETPVTTIGATVDLHIYDIARIEALSGPQGTLFGANSLSGVMRVITNQPDPSGFAAGYDVEANMYTAGEAGGSFEGFVNYPLGDRAALRLVGFFDHRGGYIDNVHHTRTYTLDDGDPDTNVTIDNAALVGDDINDVETYGGRIALGVDLNENWTSTTTLLGQHQQSDGPFPFDRRLGDDLEVTDFFPTSNEDSWWMIAETINGRIGNYDLVYAGSYFDRSIESQADYSYYSVYYDTYGSFATYFPDGNGGFLDPSQQFHQQEDYTKETHELRINSPGDRRFRFTLGAFYQKQTNEDRPDFSIAGIAAAGQTDTWVVPIPGFGDNLFIRRLHREDTDQAVFGEASFDFDDHVTLTGGVRVFDAEVSLLGFSGFASGIDRCFGPATTGGPCDNTDLSFSESGETHKISVSYDFDEDRMFYFTYSTGYRPGGVNRDDRFPPFNSDTISNFEFGYKAQTADRQHRFNVALFHQDWEDLQFGLSPPGLQGVTFTFNAGGADVDGIEADFSSHFGNLTLTGAGAYINAELSQPFCNFDSDGNALCTPAGTLLPVQPRFKGSLSARYDFAASWSPYIQATLLHQSSTRPYLLDEEVDAVESLLGGRTLSGFTSINFSGGFDLNENTAVELFLHNAFDERGELSLATQCATTYCGQYARSYPSEPRIFGARLSQRF